MVDIEAVSVAPKLVEEELEEDIEDEGGELIGSDGSVD